MKSLPQYPDVTIFDTFPKLLVHNAENYPHDVAMREKDYGIWNEITWSDYERSVRLIALGMYALGVRAEGVVGIIGDNRPQWIFSEIAAHVVRASIFGLYQDSLNDEVTYLINYAGAELIVAEDEEQVDKLLEIADECPGLKHIVYVDPRGLRKYHDDRLLSMDALLQRGSDLESQQPELFTTLVETGQATDVAILCPTSGTTSNPKLAMLQAGPLLIHCIDYLQADPRYPGDNYVSALPLPWIMEQIYAVSQALLSRTIVNFVEEPETLMDDLREIGPHFVLLAPRIWESISADIKARMMDSTPFKRLMFQLGMNLSDRASRQHRRSWLATWLLFKALKDRLGFSNLRSAATGGAALGPDTFRFFLAMGVPLRQIYGQTELCGAYTIHAADAVDFDSVGVPFKGSDVKIVDADENGVGEIIARTPGMFSGYYKNEEETRKAVDKDGWMSTGDAGYFNKDNDQLVVIDRISDLAVTSIGNKFSPQFIENKLKFSPYIAEAVTIGHDRPYLFTMVCIRFDIVAKWAEQKRIAFTNYINLSALPEVYDLIQSEIETVNYSLPEPQRIHKFLLLYKQLDADDGELTRTRKVRRGVIREKYGPIIDSVYDGIQMVPVDTEITFQDGTTSNIKTDLKVVELDVHAGSPRKAISGW